MIFTVRASSWVDRIYYLICSKGNIVVANTLEMQSTQKTFSVALSRDMVPSSRMVAYYILNGEVVSDALNFHVNGSTLNPVEVRVSNKLKNHDWPLYSNRLSLLCLFSSSECFIWLWPQKLLHKTKNVH